MAATVPDTTLRRVRCIENAWIPLLDGSRLAARIWLPEDAEQDAVPAILDYIPYRKGDGTAARDARRFPYLAARGYACVRVDIRGSGESDGLLPDEYTAREQEDGVEVLRWIGEQPWCTGRAGMIGVSWGGFSALQVAARRPPELGAIVSICASDDRYADDVHYIGGCVSGVDMLQWAASMLTYLGQPPDPAVVGPRWREQWLERLEGLTPWIEHWLGHQRRDAYWREGSVSDDRDAIDCAVLAVGGWADGYTDAVLRLVAGLRAPCRGLIGPWGHSWPEDAVPGPSIGFLQHVVRWFDHWLKGVENGVMEEPLLRAWVQDWAPPAPLYAERPGRWVAEDAWPPARPTTVLRLGDRALSALRPAIETCHVLRGDDACGLDAGAWCAEGGAGDWPLDQRGEDGRSLVFDSAPLPEGVELLGVSEAVLELSVDRPLALVAVRLCDASPTGESLLVTRGLLNLTHRAGHDRADTLEPGRRYVVRVPLLSIGQAIPAGHRLRLAVSPTYWPWAWPSPEPVTLTLHAAGESRLELPVRPPQPADAALRPFESPESAPPLEVEVTAPGLNRRVVQRDLATGALTIRFDWWSGQRSRLVASGIELLDDNVTTYRIVPGDPLSASVVCECASGVGRGDWQTRVETRSVLTADADAFRVSAALDAYEGETRVAARTWSFRIPRDGG